MTIERAEFPVKEGQEDAFAKMMNDEGLAILADAKGCSSARCARGVEDPSKFILLLDWDSVESHVALTKTDAFERFKSLAGPFFAGPSNMEHFEEI